MRRQKGIGAMRERITLLMPVKERTTTGGEVRTFTTYRETWAALENVNPSKEVDIETRETSINSKKFRFRYRAFVTEEWVIQYKDKYYDISRIDEKLDSPREHYMYAVATTRDEHVALNKVPGTVYIHEFTQVDNNFSGKSWDITQGAIPTDLSPASINSTVFFYRSGIRMVYGEDWRYEGDEIVFLKTQVRKEVLLYQQFKKVQ